MQFAVGHCEDDSARLRVGVEFDADTLRLQHSLTGVVVRLEGCTVGGEPGAPALPARIIHVALPLGTRAAALSLDPGVWTALGAGPVALAPIQPPMPGPAETYRRPEEEEWDRHVLVRRKCGLADELSLRRRPEYVPPNAALYEAAARELAARLLDAAQPGPVPIATIILRPVRIARDGRLEFSRNLDFVLELERRPDGGDESSVTPRFVSQRMRDIALAGARVVNPWTIAADLALDRSGSPASADYLVITDNQRWNETSQEPTGPAGDLVGAFERLAAWKRQRGLSAKVVTVSDIVGGAWGDFSSGSRDLQETIRNFLKMAYAEWGVAWVLIGGGIGIVPMRMVGGAAVGRIVRQQDNPPPPNHSVWSGDHLRMHVVGERNADWVASRANKLVRVADGRLIPYDATGSSGVGSPGWFFTTGTDYATRTEAPTSFVRVNGPQSLLEADFRFLYPANTIPTDLYYSSLAGGPYGQPGKHDWDLDDNLLTVQGSEAQEPDGISYQPSVSLGRAPVDDADSANVFVDKVIAYEQLRRRDGVPVGLLWPRRSLLVAANWRAEDRFTIGRSLSAPPQGNCYYHAADAPYTLIKLDTPVDMNWSLLAMDSSDDLKLIPYRTDAAAAGEGWHFAVSDTDLSPSGQSVPVCGWIPIPTKWAVVYGSAADTLQPSAYALDKAVLDTSAEDQERLRHLLWTRTGMDRPRRLYDDVHNLTVRQRFAAPIEVLTRKRLKEALAVGPHIVSFSGHGHSSLCCHTLDLPMAETLDNDPSFIAYADSCYTAQIDTYCLAEALLNNPSGGAVAYLGSTRFSWVGVGDDFQRAFFDSWAKLGGNARLGLLADSRSALADHPLKIHARWTILSQNLFGCPEMPLWWTRPRKQSLRYWHVGHRLRLLIDDSTPQGQTAAFPAAEADTVSRVHLRQRERERLFEVRAGAVDEALSSFESGPATLTITRSGYVPIILDVAIIRPSVWPRAAAAAVLLLLVLLLGYWVFAS